MSNGGWVVEYAGMLFGPWSTYAKAAQWALRCDKDRGHPTAWTIRQVHRG